MTKTKWIFDIAVVLNITILLPFPHSLCFAQWFRLNFRNRKTKTEFVCLETMLLVSKGIDFNYFQPRFVFLSNILLWSLADKPEKMLRHARFIPNVNFVLFSRDINRTYFCLRQTERGGLILSALRWNLVKNNFVTSYKTFAVYLLKVAAGNVAESFINAMQANDV